MSKLVVLKIGEGSFERGFPVTLQIGEENARPSTEVMGRLPANLELPGDYQLWQSTYRGLGLRSRLSAPASQVTNVSQVEDCDQAAEQLRDRFNTWLQADSFRPIREKCLEKLNSTETIRVIVQTEDYQLQKLPWHLWDLMERYPNAEIALSAPAYEQVSRVATPSGKIGVLAILGNSKGIDVQADRALLEQLPDAEVRLLVEPSRQDVSDRLWETPWDILFFAGHSSSQADGETGQIYINQTDSLSIKQLRNALNKAMKRGLKLAIFNSCDGLGLARSLADLHIPQVIVMREPVPDQVAQAFLKYFLQAFSTGEPLYSAVRQARERLQALEDQFPCATWLPVICQNPAEMPPTWGELRGDGEGGEDRGDGGDGEGGEDGGDRGGKEVNLSPIPLISRTSLTPRPTRLPLRWAIGISLIAAALVSGCRYLGAMQAAELAAFDQLMRLRPDEGADPRLLVVTIDDADIQRQRQNKENLRGISLSDRSLAQLLTILQKHQPRVIGLDLYRDFPVDPAQTGLVTQLRQAKNLVGICKGSSQGSDRYGIKPPPEIPPEQVGFSDFIDDPDKTVRRQILFMLQEPGSACLVPYSFSMQLAARYLEAKGVSPKITADQDLQLGEVVFHSIQGRTAGYQKIDSGGNQILLNYRATKEIAASVSLSQVLAGQIDPNAIKDRVVLIGVTADSSGDRWRTPETSDSNLPGVFVQAQMVSQILSAVLDKRPLLWVLPQAGEWVWILVWSMVGGGMVWKFRSGLAGGIAIAIAAGALILLCFIALIHGGWLPLIPPLIAAAIASTGVFTCRRFHQGLLNPGMKKVLDD